MFLIQVTSPTIRSQLCAKLNWGHITLNINTVAACEHVWTAVKASYMTFVNAAQFRSTISVVRGNCGTLQDCYNTQTRLYLICTLKVISYILLQIYKLTAVSPAQDNLPCWSSENRPDLCHSLQVHFHLLTPLCFTSVTSHPFFSTSHLQCLR